MMNVRKVFLIGMDGATWEVILPMIDAGKLPNLDRLINEGTSGNLLSTVPCISPVAWTSFMTGKNPERHGIYDFLVRQSNSYSMKCNSSSNRKSKAIWNLLSEAGRTVGIVDLILTYPPEEVNGFMLSGLGSPDRSTPFTYPIQLGAEMIREVGTYVSAAAFPDCFREAKDETKTMERFIASIFKEIENRNQITSYLMQRYPWDFFAIIFQTTDLASHYCWKYMDKSHPAYEQEKGKTFGETIYNVYERVDKAIGSFLKDMDKETTTVIVASDHGFGPLHKVVLLNNLLEKLGYLKVKKMAGIRQWSLGLCSKAKRLLVKERRIEVLEPLAVIDWSKTTAYFEGTVGNIFVNLKRREPMGIVNSGLEYEDLCRKLATDLSEVRDTENGEKFIKKIYTQNELFGIKPSEGAPDLILDLKDGYGVAGSLSSVIQGIKKGRGEIFNHNSWWSGDHSANGIFIASGPSIKKGKRINGARIVDMTPTMLYLMGVDIPGDLDGKVLVNVIDKDYLSSNPPTYSQVYNHGWKNEETTLSDEDDKKIKEKLKGLGYLE